MISFTILWYHTHLYDIILWYHIWYHMWYWFTRFLGHVISSIFHDITHDIMPFSLHHMTQETGKSISHMISYVISCKTQWFHNYVISHNCDIANYVISYVIWPGWRPAGAGAGCGRHGPPPPAPPASPSPTNWGDGFTWTEMVLIPRLDLLHLLLRP